MSSNHYSLEDSMRNRPSAEEIRKRWMKERPEDFGQADPLYTMPMDELKGLAAEQERQRAARELDERRSQTAVTFMSIEPRWKPTMKNAEAMEAELNRRNLAGTVSDFQVVFSDLASAGKLELNPRPLTPARIYTEAELRAMPLDEARAAIAEMSRNGIY